MTTPAASAPATTPAAAKAPKASASAGAAKPAKVSQPKKNYLVVPRISNVFKQHINPAGLAAAVDNLRKTAAGKATRTAETDAIAATVVAEDTAAFHAHEVSRKSNADKKKKPFTAGTLPDFTNLKVLANAVSKRLYRNTKDFNTHVTGFVNTVVSYMLSAASAHATSAGSKFVDVDSFMAVNAPSYVRQLPSYAQRNVAEPDSRSHVTYLKNILKASSTLPHKKDLLHLANNLTNDLVRLCVTHAVVLSNYNRKKTLTKETALAMVELLLAVDSSVPDLMALTLKYVTDRASDSSAAPAAAPVARAPKAAAVPKTPKAPKAAAAAPAPAAATATAAPAAGKGKGKGKGAATA